MNEQDIRQRIDTQLPGSRVEMSTEGEHLHLAITSESFAGLAQVKRQQRVYACIMDLIAAGKIHAVTIKALTPTEQPGDSGQHRHG